MVKSTSIRNCLGWFITAPVNNALYKNEFLTLIAYHCAHAKHRQCHSICICLDEVSTDVSSNGRFCVCVCLEIPLYRLNRISFGDFNEWALRCVQFNHATLNSVSNLRSRLQAIRLTIKGVYSERYLHLLFKLKNGIAVSLNCAQVLLKCNKYSFSPECESDSLCVFMLRPLHIPFSVLWTFFSSPFFLS